MDMGTEVDLEKRTEMYKSALQMCIDGYPPDKVQLCVQSAKTDSNVQQMILSWGQFDNKQDAFQSIYECASQ